MELEKFDLEKAKAGRKVVTRSGVPVEILKWDAKMGDSEIIGIIHGKEQRLGTWDLEGKYFSASESERDILLAPEERYVNLVQDTDGKKLYAEYVYTDENIAKMDGAKINLAAQYKYLGTYKLVKV